MLQGQRLLSDTCFPSLHVVQRFLSVRFTRSRLHGGHSTPGASVSYSHGQAAVNSTI